MIQTKEILKCKDIETIKSKIVSDNILNNTNYNLIDYGIILYKDEITYYGIPFSDFPLKSIKKYKWDFNVFYRWFNYLLSKSEIKISHDKYPGSFFVFNKNTCILFYSSKHNRFYVDFLICSKLYNKFLYTYRISIITNYMLESYFKLKKTNTRFDHTLEVFFNTKNLKKVNHKDLIYL